MITLRRIVQLVFLALFVLLLVLAARPMPHVWVNAYLQVSPLVALMALAGGVVGAWMLTGLALLVLTALFGRFFCGWVCPLGTTIDIGEKALFGGRRGRRAICGRRLRLIKYYLLVAVVVLALLGSGAAGWFDPISIATRSYTAVVYPVWSDLVRRGAERVSSAGPETPWAETPAAWLERRRLVAPEALDVAGQGHQPAYRGAWVFALALLALIALGAYQRRFWCRNLCPLGALLALVGRFGLVKVRVSAACINCARCQRDCKMGAFHERADSKRQAVQSECIRCFACPPMCPVDAIGIPFTAKSTTPTFERAPDTLPGRRGFLTSVAAAIMAIPLLTARFADRVGLHPRLRPPGARRPEDDFLRLCTRCGECLKVCPQNALHPAMLEHGLEAFGTPLLVPRAGYCAYECSQDPALAANLCGQVCPTGAILPLSSAEPGQPGDHRSKKTWKIGTAAFDRSTCIPWALGKDCGVCEEHCPVPGKAIVFIERDEAVGGPRRRVKLPHVVQSRCIGCGTCEYVCPVRGEPGVRVHDLQDPLAGDPRAAWEGGHDRTA
jgi:polyferredoxin